jgi:hypothetical protein
MAVPTIKNRRAKILFIMLAAPFLRGHHGTMPLITIWKTPVARVTTASQSGIETPAGFGKLDR